MTTSDTRALDSDRWVENHGDILYRYALLRVRRHETAQDLVQESLLAAVRAKDRFQGRSAERSWLIGILRNKILDYYRKLGRETTFTDLHVFEDQSEEGWDPDQFWDHHRGPSEWQSADEVRHKDEFWATLRACLSKLPGRAADVFLMREVDERETDEICDALSIKPNHLWVMLHRTRMALRQCLEKNWFQTPEHRS